MHRGFTELARQAMVVAEQEARSRNHAYVGTEHILLGLVQGANRAVAKVLQQFRISADRIRQEVEKMIQCGAEPVCAAKLPLTPRAKRAIELAEEDASFLEQDQVAPEHLLFGLLREQEGVAGQVLHGLGLTPDTLAKSVFKFRLMQMKYVERIVRTVRCTTPRKRKMREELLAHLTAIYDEELSRRSDPEAAWSSAAERFGAPAELTGELQRSLAWNERVSYYVERWCGWRPPETANRWMARAAIQSAALFALMNVGAAAAKISKFGWSEAVLIGMRPLLVVLMLLPVLLFVLGAAYFQMRDSITAFGSRRSYLVAGGMALLMGLSVLAALLAFVALTYPGFNGRSDLILRIFLTALATPLCALVIVRHVGRQEIRDALWACIDIDPPPQSGNPPVESA